MARLIFQLGDGKTVDFDLSAAVVTLGRSTSNDIVINNGWISSHHAKFERSGGSIEVMSLGTLHGIPLKEFKRVGGVYTVVDLDSHNGVMVNGEKVRSRSLKSGDRITFGQLEAVFEEAPEVTTPVPGAVKEAPAPAEEAVAARPEVARPLFTPAPVRVATEPVLARPGPPPLPVSPLPATAGVPVHATPLAAALPMPPVAAPLPSGSETTRLARPAELSVAPSVRMGGVAPTGADDPPGEPHDSQAGGLPVGGTDAVAVTWLPSDPLPAPVTPKSALESIQRDVALLEESLDALQDAVRPAGEDEHTWARGLIQRIDLLEDVMTAGDRAMPGMGAQLAPLHASLLELLREHGVERYSFTAGEVLDVATRRRITIVEPAPEGEGATEIAEVFRPGYLVVRSKGDQPPLILRKAEVRTRRRPLAPAP